MPSKKVGQIPVPVEAPEPSDVLGYLAIAGGLVVVGYVIWKKLGLPGKEEARAAIKHYWEDLGGRDAWEGTRIIIRESNRLAGKAGCAAGEGLKVVGNVLDIWTTGAEKINAYMTDPEYRERTDTIIFTAANSAIETGTRTFQEAATIVEQEAGAAMVDAGNKALDLQADLAKGASTGFVSPAIQNKARDMMNTLDRGINLLNQYCPLPF